MKSELYEWRPVVGYEGLYEVNNLGEIRSLDKFVNRNGGITCMTGRILKAWLNNQGYYIIDLYKDGKRKHIGVHRLVGQAFIPNPNSYPHINHLDRNPKNNRVENLEWVTPHLNNSYPPTLEYKSQVMTNRDDLSKPVLQLTNEGWLFKEWPSTNEIERQLGYFSTTIAECCRGNGRHHTAYGFRWEYK